MFKPTRSLLFVAVLGSSLALATPQAAPPPPPQNTNPAPPAPPAPRGELATYRARLALKADQTAQFRAILQDRKTQIAGIRNDASLSPSARKRQMKTVRADSNAKLRALLNENQAAEFDQIVRERREEAVRNRQTAMPPR